MDSDTHLIVPALAARTIALAISDAEQAAAVDAAETPQAAGVVAAETKYEANHYGGWRRQITPLVGYAINAAQSPLPPLSQSLSLS